MVLEDKVKVLVVDDTILYRTVVGDVLGNIPGVEVVGTAANGQIALTKIRSLQPDIITLDVEMPVMDGLGLLTALAQEKIGVRAIMVSTTTAAGSQNTLKALELGAFDFITKPNASSMAENKELITRSLTPKIRLIANLVKRQKMRGAGGQPGSRTSTATSSAAKTVPRPNKPGQAGKATVIALGISTGGPNALCQVIPRLPENLGVPILLVQHMPPVFTASLANSLNNKSKLTVKEAVDGDIVTKNVVYIAPGGQQMKVISGVGGKKIIKITDDPPENDCKPAVDFLFRSVAREYRDKMACVIMTGMGEDGKIGTKVAKACGAYTVAQHENSCVVYGMPKAVIEAGLADVISPLTGIAKEIKKAVGYQG